MIIQNVNWQTHRDALIRIRHNVFIDEQGISQEEEWDSHDNTAIHILVTLPQPSNTDTHTDLKATSSAVLNQHSAIACARLVIDNNKQIQIGRVAVLALYRHKGIASAVIKHAIMTAWQHSYPNRTTVYLNAQYHLLNMYQKLHFAQQGDTFLDAGITHIRMELNINTQDIPAFFNTQSQEINSSTGFACLVDLLTQHTARHIKILSATLAPTLYHQPSLCDAFLTFLRSHRHARIDIAVANTRQLGRSRHALVELAQRMPSKIKIQKIKKSLLDTGNIVANQDILTFDNAGLITLLNSQTHQGFGVFNNKVQVKRAQTHFDYIWQSHCEPDPNLRQLY